MESIRVDATLLQQFTRKTVRVLGQLKSVDSMNSSFQLECNGLITIHFQGGDLNDEGFTIGRFYEIIGMVEESDLSVKCLQVVDMGEGLNERAILQMVKMSHKVPELFYTTFP